MSTLPGNTQDSNVPVRDSRPTLQYPVVLAPGSQVVLPRVIGELGGKEDSLMGVEESPEAVGVRVHGRTPVKRVLHIFSWDRVILSV